jgi:hypothetical protein
LTALSDVRDDSKNQFFLIAYLIHFKSLNKGKLNRMLFRFKKIFLCLIFILIPNFINSDELLERREAYILTKSSWLEVKAQEKKAFLESKKEKRKLKKESLEKIRSAEKKSARYVSPNGDIFVNGLYNLKIPNEYKGKIIARVDEEQDQTLTTDNLLLGEGHHTIVYRLLDENGIVRDQKKESVYLDLSAPEVSAQLEGIFYERNSFHYYKPGVKLFLQVKDKESGIDDIYINLNRKGYLPLGKIDHPIDSPGPKEIKILVTDKVTNISQEIYLRYTVDSEPPVVDVELNTIPELHTKLGLFCDRETSIRLSAFDVGSGVSKIEFRKRGQKDWRVYRDYPLIPRNKKKISLEFRAIDNLGNESPVKHFKCKVKNEPTPIIE